MSITLERQKSADELVHTNVTVDTRDHEDHTFAGIMFDVKTKAGMPVEYLEIQAISVRGELGPITVWTTENTFCKKHESKEDWRLIYNAVQPPSYNVLQPLQLDTPLRLKPGDSCGLYVHSKTPGDSQIVYDNQRTDVTHSDQFIEILPGMAHLCNDPFSRFPEDASHWWGSPWRPRREFVGRLSYGVRWLLWNPEVHDQLPACFQKMVWSVMMSRHARSSGSYLYYLQTDILLYILNKVEWWTIGDMSQIEWLPPAAAAAAAAAAPPTSERSSVFSYPFSRLQGFFWNGRAQEESEEADCVESDDDDEYDYK